MQLVSIDGEVLFDVLRKARKHRGVKNDLLHRLIGEPELLRGA